MDNFIKFIYNNSTHVKYGLLVFVIFAMMVSIRTYINYISIESAIYGVNDNTEKIKEEIAFVKNFLIPYENSEIKEYFINHENNVLLKGESIIQFQSISSEIIEDTKIKNIIIDYINTPQKSRNKFIKDTFLSNF